jgi:5'-3' exonuclease
MNEKIAIIDADFIPYKAASIYDYKNVTEEQALSIIDNTIKNIVVYSKCTHYICFVSGGKKDFRKEQYDDYKINRKDLAKPSLFSLCKNYMINRYEVYTVNNVEADDICVSYHQQYNNTIMCSPDKDLLQSPGTHYNIKTKELFDVSHIGSITQKIDNKKKKIYSDGAKKLWHQMISGDPVDGITGIPKKGDVAAYKLLKDLTTVSDMKEAVESEYLKYYGVDFYKEEMMKTYCLVKMRDDLIIPNINKLIVPNDKIFKKSI